ncbi:MAG: hypothetical protein JNL13_10535 [Chitinophagaceae bacterium]|nr:hypothetical protein [Chitinophagaceae bacterium]
MKAVLTVLVCCLFFTEVQAQVKADTFSERFFSFLNSYNNDTLKSMQGFDFSFRNTAIPLRGTTSEKAFEAYLFTAVRYRKQYRIRKTIDAARRSFLVEEQGAYPRALGVAYPEFIFTLTLDEQGKLGALDIDTTKNYPVYRHQLQEQSKRFESWRKKKMRQAGGLEKYGDERPEQLDIILKEYEKQR